MKTAFTITALLLCKTTLFAGPKAHIDLREEGSLQGTLFSIDSNGDATAQLEISDQPITFNADAIESIRFETLESKHASNERLTLINGDEVPCTIQRINQKTVELNTWYAGKFKIPTSQISHIQFNTKPESTLYQGFNSVNDWSYVDNCKFSATNLSVGGKGSVGNNFDLPQNYSFHCKIKWDSNRPRFKIYLSGNASNLEQSIDHYMLDFNSSGIQVIRSTQTKSRNVIGEIPIRLRNIENREIDLEIRINRKTPQVIVYIDGEKQGTYHDLSFSPPIGNAIIISSEMQNREALTFSRMELKNWNGIWATKDEVKEQTNDILYKASGDVVSGSFISIKNSSNKRQLVFRHQYSEENTPHDLTSIHGITLKAPEESSKNESPVVLNLQGGGLLSVNALQLGDNKASVTHPTLGQMQIDTTALLKIQNKENQ